jgi:hypothetical protein
VTAGLNLVTVSVTFHPTAPSNPTTNPQTVHSLSHPPHGIPHTGANNTAPMNRFHLVGIALGLTAGAVAFVSGAHHPSNTLPPTPIVESDWRTKVSYSESAPVASPVESAPIEPVPAQQPAETYDEAERVKALALSHAAEKMLERCDRDWLPSTCAKMRAELGAN